MSLSEAVALVQPRTPGSLSGRVAGRLAETGNEKDLTVEGFSIWYVEEPARLRSVLAARLRVAEQPSTREMLTKQISLLERSDSAQQDL